MIDRHICSLLIKPVKPAQLSADGGNTSAAAPAVGGQVPGSRFRLSNAKVKALTARRCGGHRRNNVANEKSREKGRKEAGGRKLPMDPWINGAISFLSDGAGPGWSTSALFPASPASPAQSSNVAKTNNRGCSSQPDPAAVFS